MPRHVSSLFALLLALCVLGPALGCGPSEEDVREALDQANYCTLPEECVVLSPGCPLGCYAVVNQAEAQAMQDLIDDYHASHGHTCDYDCIAIGEPRCEMERCVVDPLQ